MAEEAAAVSVIDLLTVMKRAIELNASDIHLSPGLPPVLRIHGDLVPMEGHPVLTSAETLSIARQMATEAQWRTFEESRELDLSTSRPGLSRFRVNLYWQRNSVAIALRIIPHQIPTFEQLGLPAIIKKFAMADHGLVLVTGPTGSGKTTTLAAVVDFINENRSCHIVSIEDPIEYLHRHKKSIVNQREMHDDTLSFHESLRHVLRQDPNVILIGEMRDLETIQTALTLAETGHLVLATLHTGDAAQAITRIIDVYPPHQQNQARTQLSLVLLCTMVQQLLRRIDGGGRVLAYELLVATPAVCHLIRSGETQQIYSAIQTGGGEGMRTLNASLHDLFRQRLISHEDMMHKSARPKELLDLVAQRQTPQSHGRQAKSPGSEKGGAG